MTISPSVTSSDAPSSAACRRTDTVTCSTRSIRTTRRGGRARARREAPTRRSRHEHHRERVGLRDVHLARAARGSGRSRPEASAGRAARGTPSPRTRRARSRTRSRRRPRGRVRRSAGRSRAERAPGDAPSSAAASRCRGSIERSVGRDDPDDERDRDERLRDGNEPWRRAEVERRPVERDQEAEPEHHCRGAEREQDEAVEEPRPRAVRPARRTLQPADDDRDQRRRCRVDDRVQDGLPRRREQDARRTAERSYASSPYPPPTASDRSTRTASGKPRNSASPPRLAATTSFSRARSGSAERLASGRSCPVTASRRSSRVATRPRQRRRRAARSRGRPPRAGRRGERPGCRSPPRSSRTAARRG